MFKHSRNHKNYKKIGSFNLQNINDFDSHIVEKRASELFVEDD